MDTKQRKTVMIKVGAGLALAFVLAFLGWFLFWPEAEEGERQSPLAASDPMIPTPPTPVAAATPGSVTVTPGNIEFVQDKPDTIVFQITAQGGPVTIKDVTIPTVDTDVLKITVLDCQSAPAQLLPGNACTASVTWTGQRSVNSTITLTTTTRNEQGAPVDNTQNIAVSAVSTNPNQPQAGAPAVDGSATGQVGGAPAQPAPAAPPVQTQVASGPSPAQQAREGYLQRRLGQRNFEIDDRNAQLRQTQLQPSARSPYTSWDNIGVQGAKSSFPVDMSRVITPDKPITAVLTYQIDTRQTVTAVAMVDRDIYGSSGRTVVIPRGTKIIGRVGAGSTDRVGVAWNQIIRPDGVRFMFEGESGDAMGRGGVPGRINNRYLERYGYSLLPAITGAGITAALGGQSTQNSGISGSSQTQDAKAVAAQILQQPLNQIAQDIYQKKSQIPVQITIPAGTRVTVWSTGDLRLKPVDEDDEPRDRNGAVAQQGGQTSAFAPGRQTSAWQQGGNAGNQTAPSGQAQNGGASGGQTVDEGNTSALQVGGIDASGRYVGPGDRAPAPGPIVTNTNNGANRVTGQGAQTPSQNGQTTFPQNRNPWQ